MDQRTREKVYELDRIVQRMSLTVSTTISTSASVTILSFSNCYKGNHHQESQEGDFLQEGEKEEMLKKESAKARCYQEERSQNAQTGSK